MARSARTALRSLAPVLVAAVTLAACSAGPGADSPGASGPAPSTRTVSSRASTSPPHTSGATKAPSAPTSTTPAGAADWPTYNRTNARAGAVTGWGRPHSLALAWTARLDGAVYGQPLVVGSMVLVATEHDTVYALDRSSGRTLWRRPLGQPEPLADLPCGNIDPLGITGTPAYDAATGSVFVVTETTGAVHDLVAIDARTGAVRFRRNLDVSGRDTRAEQQRGALAVANGRVYVPFGGLYGDCGNYVGYVAAVATSNTGAVARYVVPTAREGGIWAPPGVAIGPGGDPFVAVGNGASTSGSYDGSDSVLRLAPDLSRRLDFFAEANWAAANASDADLGSSGPLPVDQGRAVMAAGKSGKVYLLNGAHLGGVGGAGGGLLATMDGCRSFGAMAYDAAAGAAFLPCTQGVLRVDVGSRSLHSAWRAPASVTGSPVVAGGAVWALDTGAGVLHVLDETTGASITSRSVGAVSRFAAPTLSAGKVLVGTLSGVTALTVQ